MKPHDILQIGFTYRDWCRIIDAIESAEASCNVLCRQAFVKQWEPSFKVLKDGADDYRRLQEELLNCLGPDHAPVHTDPMDRRNEGHGTDPGGL